MQTLPDQSPIGLQSLKGSLKVCKEVEESHDRESPWDSHIKTQKMSFAGSNDGFTNNFETVIVQDLPPIKQSPSEMLRRENQCFLDANIQD